jgi:hypothetical protein
MSYRNVYTVALALSALATALSGCGSDSGTSVEPPPSVSIAAPKVSALIPKPSNGAVPVSGVFTTDVTAPFELAPNLATSVDAQQRLFIHLNTFAEAGSANNERRSANFATLAPGAEFSIGTLNTTHPIGNILASKSGVAYLSFGAGVLSSTVMRPDVPPTLATIFSGAVNEIAVGPAVGGELFAARLALSAGSYTLETRKTASETWGAVERSVVTMPPDFSPDRTVNGVRYQLQRYTLSAALSGARGDVFVVSLSGIVDPAPASWASQYGGEYLLWRDRGSNVLKPIAYKALCQSPVPRGCLFDANNAFNNLAVANNGDITYLSDQYDSNSPAFGSRWFSAANTPQQVWLSPFSVGQPSYSLRRKDRFDFALALDGSMRSWSINGSEITLLEGPSGATPAPVTWEIANGERANCRQFIRCRVFRAETADRLAYLAWDKPVRRATLYISDRGANGGWKNVAYRDVSELLNGLDDTGEIELSAFMAAGTSDLVIGATRTGPFRDQVKLFAVSVSARIAK